MSTLCIIPARGGSKGIKLKNLQKLNEKPLLEYTINAAKKSKKIDRIIVSTDNQKISNFSKSLGIDVPFLRPKIFSRDSSTTIDVVKHTLQFLKEKQSYVPEIITILQPTSPLRNFKNIDRSVRLLKKNNCTSVIEVRELKKHPFASFKIQNNFLKPFSKNFEKYSQRQSFPELFYPTGSVYTFWNTTLTKYNSLYGTKIFPIIEKNEYVDIDTPFDLFVSEMILKNYQNFMKTRFKSNKKIEFKNI